MFFTYASRILSILMLVMGAYVVLTGVSIASGWIELPYDVALARYLPAYKTTGEAIDRGTLIIVVAVALGTLSEIAFAVRRGPDHLMGRQT